jgi:glycosyltransferase involved in cell wall biosynthesis
VFSPVAAVPTVARILFAVNSAWNLVNFRSGLIQALVGDGHEVLACAPPDAWVPRLSELGCRFIAMPMDAQGTHPLRDAALCWRLLTVMRREQPDVVLGYTIKPNVYASLAARWAGGVKVVNNIAGLGATFIQPTWVTPVVKRLYRLALNRSSTVFFQNEDDRELFVDQGLVARGNTQLLPGSGVDLQRYAPADPRAADGRFRFLMVSRLLWDKGVGELVEAARRLRLRHPEVQVQLLGFLDVQNPSAIQRRDVQAWESEGVIQYLGASDDPRPYIAHSDCVVLPSYREGTPRSLLEAAAMGKPLITTDVPGCRTVVEDGNNGFLCPARDATALADQMSRMVMLNAAERDAMGRQGRQKMEREFDERLVIGHYRRAIAKALQPDRRP